MIGPGLRARLWGAALYLLMAFLLLFYRLLPIAPGGIGWPGPNWLLALTLAWVLRRPDQLPAPLIAGVVLVEDLVLMRPPGLWAAVVLLGAEAARKREARWREQGFMVEWLWVSGLMGMMMLANRVASILFLLPVPPLGMVLMQLIATVAAYPVTVLFSRVVLGLRRMGPVEADRLGYR